MDPLIEDLRGDRILGYAIVLVATLVSYEYLIMLNKEIQYLWTQRLSFGGALFFLCRYLPFLSAIQIYLFASPLDLHQLNCIVGFRTNTCIVFVEFLLSIAVLFTRAYAVWGCTRRMRYFLALTYICVFIGGVTSIYLFMHGVRSIRQSLLCLSSLTLTSLSERCILPSVLIDSQGCLVQIVNNDLWIALVILIFSESLALGLLLTKYAKYSRELKRAGCKSNRDIMKVMVHDGVAYFACNFVITTTNLFLLMHVNPDFQDIFLVTQGALENILCSRLFFHIRSANDASVTISQILTSSRSVLSSAPELEAGVPALP
ncbi:hypothetical protein SCHPADRAFT_591576 [Schizopora paradoxa]|uniref:DUF6533 domain-containing protein n=1 Tax=Schizopora paradoxa TaxID=27342 RepID=A0A0H2RVT7_9AGAM|nr:hypothetical protein SCHPADRAFT_591576 [Schizopora paradoxa]